MGPNEKQDKLIEYLYGEISTEDMLEFRHSLDTDPHLGGEIKSYLQLRQLFHEHLPEKKAPAALTEKLLWDLGVKRPWYAFLSGGLWRPALAGAFVLALTLGISQGLQRVEDGPPTFAVKQNVPAISSHRSAPQGQAISDSLLANRSLSPQLNLPARVYRAETPFYETRPLVSLAGYGQPLIDSPTAMIPEAEIERLEMEADHSLAQFRHQQAIRMRNIGEFKAAADILGQMVREFPFYPFKLQAMAQRVDSLFRAGENDLARKELRVLNSLSPTMAYILERRWLEQI